MISDTVGIFSIHGEEDVNKRAESDPRSLTLDEVGVLFLVTRDRIRAIEGNARGTELG
jgi:hypothetical protein